MNIVQHVHVTMSMKEFGGIQPAARISFRRMSKGRPLDFILLSVISQRRDGRTIANSNDETSNNCVDFGVLDG